MPLSCFCLEYHKIQTHQCSTLSNRVKACPSINRSTYASIVHSWKQHSQQINRKFKQKVILWLFFHWWLILNGFQLIKDNQVKVHFPFSFLASFLYCKVIELLPEWTRQSNNSLILHYRLSSTMYNATLFVVSGFFSPLSR